jgi:alpha-glucosidase
MKLNLSIFLLLCLMHVTGQSYILNSPDNTIKVEITAGPSVTFKVTADGNELMTPSALGIEIDKIKPGVLQVKKTVQRSVDQLVQPVIPEKSSRIKDNFNELSIQYKNKLTLTFRAYNQGIAYRWVSAIADSITVIGEMADYGFNAGDNSWFPSEKSFYSHNERLYKQYRIRQITKDSLASLPTLVVHSGISVLISEADLFDYPGMWLTGNGSNKLSAVFSHHPSAEKATGDRDVQISTADNYLARTTGTRSFPWRIFMIARKDGDLLNNQLVYLLSRSATEDYSWVKPGKIAWDWWNALNIDRVDFISGINTATYKYYIDFAAKYGLEYIILDEGWSPTTDITRASDGLNMAELTAYAKEKKVGIILWVLWTSLDKQMKEAMDLYNQWGIKGIKVDFMQRDDQKMVNFYERTAKEAAKRKLLVDFHGAFKPTGMERLYPNVITREGVYGMEQSKWDASKSIGPEHNVTLPFIRNAVGPMDYTPGAMLNAQRESWAPVFQRPMSLGTRCHQLAMYVVFTSPLQMLSDAPSNYYREPQCMEFLKQVPTVWDETVVLLAKTGDYVALARKAVNGNWYIGAMTDWTPRDLQLDLSFLGIGNYTMDVWQDGINADRNANDFTMKSVTVSGNSKQNIHLAPGGGWVAIVHSAKQ